jgi:hypothetical protein
VRVRYLRPSGEVPLEKTYILRPTRARTSGSTSRSSRPRHRAGATDVSAVFDSLNGQPIIVERALYLDRPGQTSSRPATRAPASSRPAMQWFLAEGATGDYFDLFVLIANPGDRPSAIEATYLLPDGTTITKPYTVPPTAASTSGSTGEDPHLADTAVSTTIRSVNGVPVIVERALWWPSEVSAGTKRTTRPVRPSTGTAWAVAEGEVGGPRDRSSTYILRGQHLDRRPGSVRVTLFEDGTSASSAPSPCRPNSRFNVDVRSEFPTPSGGASGRWSRASARRPRRSSSSAPCTGTPVACG